MTHSFRVSHNKPLAEKTAHTLYDFIYKNFPKGGKLPSEAELAGMFGVNIGTVHQALNILNHLGLIYRQQGLGTFVNRRLMDLQKNSNVQFRLDFHLEYGDLIRDSGHRVKVDLQGWQMIPASGEITTALEIMPNAQCVQVEKLFFIDDCPAIFLREVIPSTLFSTPIDQVDFQRNIFEILEDSCGSLADYGVSQIIPVVCGEQLGSILGLDPSEAIMRMTSVYCQVDSSPAVYGDGYFNTKLITMNVLRRRQLWA